MTLEDLSHVPGAVEIGVLADIALGAAVRRVVGHDHRVATIALTIDMLSTPSADGPLSIAGHDVISDARLGSRAPLLANAMIYEPSAQLGICSAAFLGREPGYAALPWEIPIETPPPRLGEAELTTEERQLLSIVTSSSTAPGTALLEHATTHEPNGTLRLKPLAVLANRVGVVQGGVLTGLAVSAADPQRQSSLRAIRVEFLAPASLERTVTTRRTVLREGLRNRLCRVDIYQDEVLAVTATVRLELRKN